MFPPDLDRTGVDAHADPKRADLRPRLGRQGALPVDRRADGRHRVAERGVDRVADRLEDDAAGILDRRGEELMVARDRRGVPTRTGLEQPGARLDVGEEECHGAGRQVHRPRLLQAEPNVSPVMDRPAPEGIASAFMPPTPISTVLPFDPATASERELEESGRLQQVLAGERVPEDPPMPVAALVRRMSTTTPSEWRAMVSARDGRGSLVGMGFVGRHLNEPENAHIRWCEIGVHPEHRRSGIGRALFASLVAACEGQGEDLTFMGQTSDRVPPGEGFCRALGAEAGLAMKTNQLDLTTLDRQSLEQWAAQSAAGYRLETAVNITPDALMPAYLEAANGMNDAPKGTMRFADERVTAEQVRDHEAWARAAGMERRLIVAVHEATGEGAGFTGLGYDPSMPHIVQQRGTAVIGGHRGHGIGLWMKATMLRRVLSEWPAARYVRTGNAHTNEQMLAINTRLGFRHAWSTLMWQLPLAAARAHTATAAHPGSVEAADRRP